MRWPIFDFFKRSSIKLRSSSSAESSSSRSTLSGSCSKKIKVYLVFLLF